jgi:hypothetical protein
MAHVIEHLKALSSNMITTKEKKEKEKRTACTKY